MKLQQIMKLMDQIAPLRLAESWDNVGLLLGDPASEVHKVMTCLTLSPDVADEAVTENAELVIAHHPILFRPTKVIRADQAGSDIVWKLARKGIAVTSVTVSIRLREMRIVIPLVSLEVSDGATLSIFES